MEKITATSNGLSVEAFVSTLLYTILGISIMLITLVLVNLIFRLNMRHELVEENNTAYGIMISGITISVALIIAGTILS